jgi:hypothetical protein
MSQYQSERQASNNRAPVGNNDNFENNQINFPTQLSQFSQPQGEPSHRDHSAGAVDSSRPHGPRHKRQRSSPDVAQESPLPQILGLLSKVSQEEKEKIIAILREQDQSSISAGMFRSRFIRLRLRLLNLRQTSSAHQQKISQIEVWRPA